VRPMDYRVGLTLMVLKPTGNTPAFIPQPKHRADFRRESGREP
jgi:hypothetical protein